MTVVVPAHNRSRVIERAVASALGQRPDPPAQVLVIDDCSTDDTASRAEAAGAQVIRHDTNRGPGGARNTGIYAAAQPWVAFLDSDDEWLPHHLHDARSAFNGHVLVSAPGIVPPVAGRSARITGNGTGRLVELDSPMTFLEPENLIATSGTVVSTTAARAAGGFSAGYKSEDLDFWIRVLEQGPGRALPSPGYIYHQEPGHISADTAGMHAAAMSYLESYAAREWFDAAALRRIADRRRWDEFRAELRAGRRRAACRDAAWIVTHPSAVSAIVPLLVFRRHSRANGTRAMSSLPEDVSWPGQPV